MRTEGRKEKREEIKVKKGKGEVKKINTRKE